MTELHWKVDAWDAIYLTDGRKVFGHVYNDGPGEWRSVLALGADPQRHATEREARERVEEEARRGQA
jgi:hypothetical protein